MVAPFFSTANAQTNLPGPLQRLHTARIKNAAPAKLRTGSSTHVLLFRLFFFDPLKFPLEEPIVGTNPKLAIGRALCGSDLRLALSHVHNVGLCVDDVFEWDRFSIEPAARDRNSIDASLVI